MSRFLRTSALVVSMSSMACAAVFGFERLSEEGSDAGPIADQSAPDADDDVQQPGCDSVGVPPRPSVDAVGTLLVPDGGTVDGGSVSQQLFAMRWMDLTSERSLNLDRTCTTDPATSACILAANPEQFDFYVKDEDGGDRASGKLLPSLAVLFADIFSRAAIEDRIKNGRLGMVVSLSEWNGTTDDSSVVVQLYPALGMWARLPDGGLEAGGPPGDNSTLPKPNFEADDLYLTDSRFLRGTNPVISGIFSDTAYVKDGAVVASFGKMTVPIRISGDLRMIDVVVRDAWLVGRLTPDGQKGNLSLTEGTMAGRWATVDLLDQVSRIFVRSALGSPQYLCDPIPTAFGAYVTFWDRLCPASDVRARSVDDFKSLPCDALSASVAFEAYQVNELGPGFDQSSRYSDAALEVPPEQRCVAPDSTRADAGCTSRPVLRDAGVPD